MAEHRDVAIVRRLWAATADEASAAASAELWAPDCTHLVPGNNRFSGEHKGREAIAQLYQQYWAETGETLRVGPEPQQLFADGHGHVVGVRRWTADRDGRHLDSFGASVYTVVGDRLASIEQCEEDVDQVDEFWGGSASGLGTDWRADIGPVLRGYQGNEESSGSVHRETCTADVRYHVPGHHPLSGDFQGPDEVRQWAERTRRESGGTVHWQPEHTFADGHGHVIVARRVTADRRGRHLDTRGAIHCTIRDGLLSDVEMYEEDLDAVQEFWA
jgi:uncharacterized protein